MKPTLLVLLVSLGTNVAGWTDSYAPQEIACPKGSLVRDAAEGLSVKETAYLAKRNKVTRPHLKKFLSNCNLDIDVNSLVSNATGRMNIGLSISGGSYRALLSGAGVLTAMDSRVPGTSQRGQLGGLLQSSSYITGLSGSSWLIGSMYMNNFTTIDRLVNNPRIWNFENTILLPSGGEDPQSDIDLWMEIVTDVLAKAAAGFDVSLIDAWSRLLAHQFFDYPRGGVGLQLSDMANWPWFQQAEAPFPIISSAQRKMSVSGAQYTAQLEHTPFELGAYDRRINGFIDQKYLGTQVDNGIPMDTCYTGLDNAGLVLGTSSAVFDNGLDIVVKNAPIPGVMKMMIQGLLSKFDLDLGIYRPNPFFHWTNASDKDVQKSDALYLVDGGDIASATPIQPLLQVERGIDVAFVVDVSEDTAYNYPNGASIVKTYEDQFASSRPDNFVSFPYVPDTTTFINEGLIDKPSFFGCSAKNLTSLGGPGVPPLVVYLPLNSYSHYVNTTWLQLAYPRHTVNDFINNGYNLATQLNSTRDPEWATCVGCAIVQRELERRGEEPSPKCQRCFAKYCWDGTINTSEPEKARHYSPVLIADRVNNLTAVH